MFPAQYKLFLMSSKLFFISYSAASTVTTLPQASFQHCYLNPNCCTICTNWIISYTVFKETHSYWSTLNRSLSREFEVICQGIWTISGIMDRYPHFSLRHFCIFQCRGENESTEEGWILNAQWNPGNNAMPLSHNQTNSEFCVWVNCVVVQVCHCRLSCWVSVQPDLWVRGGTDTQS